MQPIAFAQFMFALTILGAVPRPAMAQPQVQTLAFEHPSRATDFAYSWAPSGDRLAVDFYDTLGAYDIDALTPLEGLRTSLHGWRILDWSHDGRSLLLARMAPEGRKPNNAPVVRFDLASQAPTATFFGSAAAQLGRFSPDGQHVAIATPFSDVRIYNAATGVLTARVREKATTAQPMGWSPCSRYLVIPGVLRNTARFSVYDVTADNILAKVVVDAGAEDNAVVWAHHVSNMATACGQGLAMCVYSKEGQPLVRVNHGAKVVDTLWSHNDTYVLSTDVAGGVKITRVDDGRVVMNHRADDVAGPAASWAPDADIAVYGGYSLEQWSPEGHKTLRAPGAMVLQLAHAPSGLYFAEMTDAEVRIFKTGALHDPGWQVPGSAAASTLCWARQGWSLAVARKAGILKVTLGF